MIRRAPLPVYPRFFVHKVGTRDRPLAMMMASRAIPGAALISVDHNALTKRGDLRRKKLPYLYSPLS